MRGHRLGVVVPWPISGQGWRSVKKPSRAVDLSTQLTVARSHFPLNSRLTILTFLFPFLIFLSSRFPFSRIGVQRSVVSLEKCVLCLILSALIFRSSNFFASTCATISQAWLRHPARASPCTKKTRRPSAFTVSFCTRQRFWR